MCFMASDTSSMVAPLSNVLFPSRQSFMFSALPGTTARKSDMDQTFWSLSIFCCFSILQPMPLIFKMSGVFQLFYPALTNPCLMPVTFLTSDFPSSLHTLDLSLFSLSPSISSFHPSSDTTLHAILHAVHVDLSLSKSKCQSGLKTRLGKKPAKIFPGRKLLYPFLLFRENHEWQEVFLNSIFTWAFMRVARLGLGR